MNVPKNIDFPEVTNSNINIALVAGRLNELLAFLRDKYPEEIISNVFTNCQHESRYSLNRAKLWRCKTCKKIFKVLK